MKEIRDNLYSFVNSDKYSYTQEAQQMPYILTPDMLKQFAPALGDKVTLVADIIAKSELNTPLRIAHFLAQTAHESGGFKLTVENMNYSAAALGATFGKYFPTEAIRNQYARKPEMIGNRAYASRNGNGPESSGDGFRYRGRGYLQLTGKNNYAEYSKDTYGDDRVVKNPSLVEAPEDAIKSSLWYWKKNNLNKWVDTDDVLAVSRLVNLGSATSKATPNGLDDRKNYLKKAKAILKIA